MKIIYAIPLFLTFSISGCNSFQEHVDEEVIFVAIDCKELFTVNEKDTPEENLQKVLLYKIERIESLGYLREEIIIDVQVHSNVTMRTVTDFQMILKDLKIRKVLYSNSTRCSKSSAGRLGTPLSQVFLFGRLVIFNEKQGL